MIHPILILFVAANLLPVCEVVPSFQDNGLENVSENSTCVPYSNQPNAVLRCGGALEGQSGTIFHKPYEYIEDNERCVWSINIQSEISFNVLYLGYSTSDNRNDSSPRLDITGVNVKYNGMYDNTL